MEKGDQSLTPKPSLDPFIGYRRTYEVLQVRIESEMTGIRDAQERLGKMQQASAVLKVFTDEGAQLASQALISPEVVQQYLFSGQQLYQSVYQQGLSTPPPTAVTGGLMADTTMNNISGHVSESKIFPYPSFSFENTEALMAVHSLPVQSVLSRLADEVSRRYSELSGEVRSVASDVEQTTHSDSWGIGAKRLRGVIEYLCRAVQPNLEIEKWSEVELSEEAKTPTRASRIRFAVFGMLPSASYPDDLVESAKRLARVIPSAYSNLSKYIHRPDLPVEGVFARTFIYQTATDLLEWFALADLGAKARKDILLEIVADRVWATRDDLIVRLEEEFTHVYDDEYSVPHCMEVVETADQAAVYVEVVATFTGEMGSRGDVARDEGLSGKVKRHFQAKFIVPWNSIGKEIEDQEVELLDSPSDRRAPRWPDDFRQQWHPL